MDQGTPRTIATSSLSIPSAPSSWTFPEDKLFATSSLSIPAAPSSWTFPEDKLFETALVLFPAETPDRWEKIAGQVPGKSLSELKEHYMDLVHDVYMIESGLVELPCYSDDDTTSDDDMTSEDMTPSGSKTEKRKASSWTTEEHRRFLDGLEKYGKGDWRSISRYAVVSKTPTQVASHAQKYFLRQNSTKPKKRTSIHDITMPEHGTNTIPTSQPQPSSGVMVQQAEGSSGNQQYTIATSQSQPSSGVLVQQAVGLPAPLGRRRLVWEPRV